MNPGSLLIVPTNSYVNFYSDLRPGKSERILGNQTMLVLSGHSDGGWSKVLHSDQRVGFICTIGLKAIHDPR